MNEERIKNIKKLNDQIENFRQCCELDKLYANQDGEVTHEKLLSFLIENPHFQEMANDIKKISRGL